MFGAFMYCDPGNTGYVRYPLRLANLARAVIPSLMSESDDDVWHTMDKDGNGFASFAEFVSWLEQMGAKFPIGIEGEIDPIVVNGIPLPPNWWGPWDATSAGRNVREQVKNSELMRDLQQLLDVSYKKVWTRDRGTDKKVPDRYSLVSAYHSDNYHDWRRYFIRRHQVAHQCTRLPYAMEQRKPSTNLTNLAGKHRLRPQANEWLLFHGTAPDKVESICSGDFTMQLCGTATGTLYGKGTYMAESITKADEYCTEASNGLCYALVCRVTGGNVLYNDEVTPDGAVLQNQVVGSNTYHSVWGDRDKCRGTFKEIVIYDADQIYVEYVVAYRREFDA